MQYESYCSNLGCNIIVDSSSKASDMQFDETGNWKRKHHYDGEDEIKMEQQEHKQWQMLNKEFKLFAGQVAALTSVRSFFGSFHT